MKQLDPKSVYIFFFNFLMVAPFFVAILVVSIWSVLISFKNPTTTGTNMAIIPFDLQTSILIAIPLLLIACYIWAKLSYHFYRYELTDIGFRKESGVIYKKYVTIPYERIQNVDINRGILARILGLSDLQIQTAGYSAVTAGRGLYGMSAEGILPGLSKDIAEQLRDELVQRSLKSRNQGL